MKVMNMNSNIIERLEAVFFEEYRLVVVIAAVKSLNSTLIIGPIMRL